MVIEVKLLKFKKMKKIYSYVLMAAALIASASCEKGNQTGNEPEGESLVFHASYEPESKTVIGEIADGKAKVFWSGKESIKVTAGTGSGDEFARTDGESDSATAEFSGEYFEWSGSIYAIYPGANPWFDLGETVVYEDLAAEQTAKAGSFADKTMISVAKADESMNLYFKNVTGVLGFSLGSDFSNVESVEFYGNKGEDLAGRMKIDLNTLEILSQENQKKSIVLNAEEGAVLTCGAMYYMVAVPKVLEHGFTVLVHCKDGKTYSKSSSRRNEIKRGVVLNLGTLSPDSFTAVTADELYIVGHAVPDNNWDISKAVKMNKVADGVFKYGNRLIGGKEGDNGCYKFVLNQTNWWPSFVRGDENHRLRHYTSDPSAGDIKFNVGDDNAYTVTVDLNKMTHTVEYIAPESHMWLVGDASPFGWLENNNAYDAVLTATDDSKTIFTWTGQLTDGELKISTDLRTSWGGEWIYATANGQEIGSLEEETVSFEMRISGVGVNDNKWKVVAAGNYTVTVNTATSKITFKKNL